MLWASGFWSPGFWASGFWQEASNPTPTQARLLPPVKEALVLSSDVTTLVAGRIYRHSRKPQDAVAPYITWSVISGLPENNLSDLPPTDHLVIQVDHWSLDDQQVEDLARYSRDAIEPYAHMTGVVADEREADTKLFRIGLQFDWWLSRV
jgi:hypothetical protein